MVMSLKDAFDRWESDIKPEVIAMYGEDDGPALSESWNNYTDSLCKDGELNSLQYNKCPSYDDDIPDGTEEELAYILEAMGVKFSAIRIDRRRDNTGTEWSKDARHWSIRLERDGKDAFELEFSQGSGHTLPPEEADVFSCILRDSSNTDGTFENWCDDYGYDSDSRKAESIFRACCDIAQKLRGMFSKSELDDLAELLEDY